MSTTRSADRSHGPLSRLLTGTAASLTASLERRTLACRDAAPGCSTQGPRRARGGAGQDLGQHRVVCIEQSSLWSEHSSQQSPLPKTSLYRVVTASPFVRCCDLRIDICAIVTGPCATFEGGLGYVLQFNGTTWLVDVVSSDPQGRWRCAARLLAACASCMRLLNMRSTSC
jgi:hypothetical protein